MAKLVVLKLGDRNLGAGFLATLRIEEYGTLLVEASGKLAQFPELFESFECWQLAYSSLELSWRSLRKKPQRSTSIIGIDKFKELSYKLKETLNDWLNYQEFRSIREAFLMQLSRAEEVHVLIQTEDIQVRRLPWHLWDIFEYYPKAEIALGESTYTRIHRPSSSLLKDKVRILAVLGNSHGINLQKDQELLANLPDTDIRFLVEPSRRELNRQLWEEQGWDILFFAGHSYSKTDGKTGHLCINSTQNLLISELKNALKTSIERGLQIAIFNSCDGLGIAQNLSDLHIPQVICMREPVPDIVAQEFLLHFLKSFSSGKSLYISVREARERLEGLENDFPCASWLPVIFQNLGESLLTWQELCPMSLGTQQQAQNEDCNLYTKRVEPWNKCRENNPELVPDFKEINLSGVNLAGANLSRVNLSRVHVGYQANYNIKAHPFLRIRDFPELGKEIIDTYQSIIHYLAIDPHQKPSPRSNIRPLQGFLSDCNALEMTFKRTGIIYTLVYQIAPQLDSTVYIISFAKSQIAIERAIERILLQEQFPHNQAINNVFFSSINNVKAGQENSISKNHQGIYKPMSEITNNNQNANIANFVNEEDNAQVTASNFSKTSGANTAELLQLITTMRQTATQFPREIQDDIIIDIDDVEEEIKKPENQRNSTRLRKRLIALATLASMITTPVAGITDFANNAIDLGNKLGIELQLPSAP